MNKSYALAEVKAVESNSPHGEFEAILSAPTLDRDGEVIDAGAFAKGPGGLPPSIPVHAFHDFSDPIGRGVPAYKGDVLKLRGFYASTPRAQEIRTLVAEGVIAHMSVGFMPPEREEKDGVVHISAAELLEGSFVSIPSNREAAVLMAKSADATRPTHVDSQAIHDLAVKSGAVCSHAAPEVPAAADPEKAAAPAAASPADAPVGRAPLSVTALEAEANLLLLP